jgi:hypothetical protein
LTTRLEIENCQLLVDTDKTHEFYQTQNKIVDDCQCADCKFYSETFLKEPLEIFSILSSFGVDLQKNLSKEPTGVWCVRDKNDTFLHCDQLYQIVGRFSNCDKFQARYEKLENGYKVNAFFVMSGTDDIEITLNIDKS